MPLHSGLSMPHPDTAVAVTHACPHNKHITGFPTALTTADSDHKGKFAFQLPFWNLPPVIFVLGNKNPFPQRYSQGRPNLGQGDLKSPLPSKLKQLKDSCIPVVCVSTLEGMRLGTTAFALGTKKAHHHSHAWRAPSPRISSSDNPKRRKKNLTEVVFQAYLEHWNMGFEVLKIPMGDTKLCLKPRKWKEKKRCKPKPKI